MIRIVRMENERMQRFEMKAPAPWLARIDDWRRQQPDIPSRAEAIRRLVETAIEADAAP